MRNAVLLAMALGTTVAWGSGDAGDWKLRPRSAETLRERAREMTLAPQTLTFHAEPRPEIETLVSRVDAARIRADVIRVSALKNRGYATAEMQALIDALEQELAQLGYQARQQCFQHAGRKTCNLIAERAGTQLPGEVVLVVAHPDSVGHPGAGANDNASGTAGLLEMARVLAAQPLPRTVRFLLANAEEAGLRGSRHYADNLAVPELAAIRLVINMDMIGAPRAGRIKLETDKPHQAMADWYAGLARAYTTLIPEIAMPAWGSDHVTFLKKGIPSLLTIDDTDVDNPCYHRACDTAEKIDAAYVAQVIRLNVAAAAEKAGL